MAFLGNEVKMEGVVKRVISAFVLSFAMLFCSHLAFAQETTGVYVAGKGGLSFENSNIKGKIAGGGNDTDGFGVQDLFGSSNHNSTNTSGAFGGAIGYDFSQFPFRVELEYLYRTQSKSNFVNGGTSNIMWNGTSFGLFANNFAAFSRQDTIHTLMFNGYWDITNYNGFVPYVGGGIGLAFHNLHDSVNVAGTPVPAAAAFLSPYGYGISKNQTLTQFAWMATAGVAYKINPNWTIDLGYRLISFGDTGTTSLGAASYNGLIPCEATASIKENTTLSNEVLLSLRYTF